MAITVYSSHLKKKIPFSPIEEGKVRMYVCGITAYDRCHIGHARSAVVFDSIFRYLREKGFEVKFIRNFTDIDDKIINRAKEEGISPKELAEREIAHFYEDMDALGIERATFEPRATEHIPEIIALIETLIEKGHAYERGGDVYFRVRTFPQYGELSGRNIDELRAGARIDVGELKDDPLDFALWKGAKPGEPKWDSPWGEGRPGWHIECSAMSMKYLGNTLDIHGGGLDLIFPHHENEKAQSEAATGRPFVNYWLHNGFVTIKGEKMSKSLGNFITIKDILSEFHPEALRLFLLSKHYRSPLDYSPEALRENEAAISRCYYTLFEALDVIEAPVKKKRPIEGRAQDALRELEGVKQAFYSAMDDDFNTAKAVGHLFEGIRHLNTVIEEAKRRPSALYKDELQEALKTFSTIGKVLGILQEDPKEFLERRNISYLKSIGLTKEYVEDAIKRRELARKAKDWQTADSIRDELQSKGISLMDTPQGTRWRIEK
ncbi:Cysteinyl-tRNA synthetase [Dissulfuribacter thermophilus]|uniref:Cysteine--tRNA ligase n=1 Tax=Dissulfuribacter thermophilus TaxID=1156395 RepID=A0A1B9F912_9BACT|nr:cysteine--tRNA ligase [Dissulfuribacter thermophilus]OCC16407.1 Cysteinyl-tRNA synthetase [Dissulfuribacter thermophilus]